jgi:hypothetical protein
MPQTMHGSSANTPEEQINTYVYNNTFYCEGRTAIWIFDGNVKGMNIFNNIFFDNSSGGAENYENYFWEPQDLYSDYNLLYKPGQGASYNYFYWSGQGAMSLSEWRTFKGLDDSTTIGNPGFIGDTANGEFTIHSDSAAASGGRGGAYPSYRGAFAPGEGSADGGIRDTVAIVVTQAPDYNAEQFNVELQLWVYSDGLVTGATSGWSWDNPNLQMLSATDASTSANGFDIGPFLYEGGSLAETNANRRFLFGGARTTSPGVIGASGRRLWATYSFILSNWTVNDAIMVDTNSFNSGSVYMFINDEGQTYYPKWEGRLVIHDPNRPEIMDSLTVDSSHVNFTASQGGSSPNGQTVSVTSSNGALDYSISASSAWLTLSDSSGTTPDSFVVDVDISGLAVGAHVDTIMISSAGADNSPKLISVQLSILPSSSGNVAAYVSPLVSGTYAGYDTEPITDAIIDASGGTASTWASDESSVSAHWVELDFGSSVVVDTVIIYWAWNDVQQAWMTSQEYSIQRWNNSDWEDIQVISDNTVGNVTVTEVTQFSTTRLRIHQPANMGPPDYSVIMWLTELEVHGMPDGTDLTPPAQIIDLAVQ